MCVCVRVCVCVFEEIGPAKNSTGSFLANNNNKHSVLIPHTTQPPAALYQGAVAAGAAKATAPWKKIFTLGIVSGCHIAFGAYLAITVGGACPGIAAENPGLQKVRFGQQTSGTAIRV
jgi:hypothetical protein